MHISRWILVLALAASSIAFGDEATQTLNVTVVDNMGNPIPSFTVSVGRTREKLGEGKDGKFSKNIGTNLAIIQNANSPNVVEVQVPIGEGTPYPHGYNILQPPLTLTPRGWETTITITPAKPEQYKDRFASSLLLPARMEGTEHTVQFSILQPPPTPYPPQRVRAGTGSGYHLPLPNETSILQTPLSLNLLEQEKTSSLPFSVSRSISHDYGTNRITVRVENLVGKPVPNFKVWLLNGGFSAPQELGEGKDGEFSKSISQPLLFVETRRTNDGKEIPVSGSQVIVKAPGYPAQLSDPLVSGKNGHETRMVLGGLGKERAIQCSVLLPDGTPATDAYLCLPSGSCNFGWKGELHQMSGDLARTDAKGKLAFAARDLGTLWLVHNDGVLATSYQELLASKEVRLQPWGRIEGVRLLHGKPKAGLDFQLSHEAGLRFHRPFQTATDRDGRFVFEKVPPGKLTLKTLVPASFGTLSNSPLEIEVSAGQTTTVSYETDGRWLTGHFVVPQVDSIDWPRAAAKSKLVPIDEWNRWLALNSNSSTPFGCAYEVEFDYDGAFYAYGIPAGTYMLHIQLETPAKYPMPDTKSKLAEMVEKVIVGTEGTVHMGVLTANVDPLRVPLLQPLSAACYPAESLKLEDFRGKFLLIKHHEIKTTPDTVEFADLQKLREKYADKLEVLVVFNPGYEGKLALTEDFSHLWKNLRTTELSNRKWWDLRNAWAVSDGTLILLDPDSKIVYRNIKPEQLNRAAWGQMNKKEK